MCPEIFANTRRSIVSIATGRRIAASATAGRSLVIAVAVVVTIVVIIVLGEHTRHHILHLREHLLFTSLEIFLRLCMMLAMKEKGSVKTDASEFGIISSGAGGSVARVPTGV